MFDYKSLCKVQIKVTGANLENLINTLQNKKIKFKVQRLGSTEMLFELQQNNLPLMFDLLQKKCYSYSITQKSGIKLSNLVGIVLGLVLVFVAFLCVSNFCLNYKIIADNDELNQEISQVLENLDIKGKVWSELDFCQIEDALLNNISKLSMCNVSKNGLYLIVNAKSAIEKDDLPNVEQGQGLFSNANGVVSRIFVASGTALCKVGDTVSFGQMLVAPYVENEQGERTEVQVKADVYLYIWDSYNKQFTEQCYEYVRTGASVKESKMQFRDDVLAERKVDVPFEHYEVEISKVYISSVLPVEMIYTTYYETTPILVQKSFEQEKDALIYEARQELLKKVDEASVLEEKHTISLVGDTYNITYYAKREIKV